MPEDTKKCTKCLNSLPVDKFRKKKRRPGQKHGLTARCIDCLNKSARERYHARKAAAQKNVSRRKEKNNLQPDHKVCSNCLKELPFDAFFPCCKEPTSAWHYDSKCKECKKLTYKKYSKSDYTRPSSLKIEHKLIESKRKKVKDGKIRTAIGHKSFSIGIKDVRRILEECNMKCSVTGVELLDTMSDPLSPSIDRIDNARGYEPNNIRIVALTYSLCRNKWDDIDACAAIYGLNTENNQDWGWAEHETIKQRTKSAINGIYTNPGSLRKYKFNLIESDIRQTILDHSSDGILRCGLSGVPLDNRISGPLAPSIDRINSRRGYKSDNIRITARCINLAKWKWDDNIFLDAVDKIRDAQSDLYNVGKLKLFGDEISRKRDIIKGIGAKPTRSVRPQKCEIKLIDNQEAKLFYDMYHYMGGVPASYNIGVFAYGNLSACLSIRKPSGINCKDDWEISRMARNPAIKIHGIWSYLMKWIKSNKLINGSLITFSDNRLFDGKVYEHMRMQKIKDVPPTYCWMRNGIRYHRRRDQSESELISNGYKKVHDIGKKKWQIVI